MVDLERLTELYTDIRDCRVCPRMDREKASRLVGAVNVNSDVFIISQALAANQLRKSGVNFFRADGRLGNTGVALERFLNKVGRTVYPKRAILMPSGAMINECGAGYVTVYNTEVAQCYPGKNALGNGDREPSRRELQTCVGQGFLAREIEFIGPRLLLLMGKASRDAFYSYVVNAEHPRSLTEHISRIVNEGSIPRLTLGSISLYVLPIQHASGSNPRFHSMLQDHGLIELIREVLDG